MRELRSRFVDAGRGEPLVTTFGALGHDSETADLERLQALEELGVSDFVQGGRSEDLDGFRRDRDRLGVRRSAFRAPQRPISGS